jgi:hypothetical protein
VGKPKGKRPLGLSKRRWEDNITAVDLGEVERLGVTGIYWLMIGTNGRLL